MLKYFAQIYRAQYEGAMLVYRGRATPLLRVENNVNIWNLLWLSRRLVLSTEQIKQGLHKHFSYYFDFRGTGERSRDKYIFFNRPFGSSVLRTP